MALTVLSEVAYADMRRDAKVTAADHHGDKVLRLGDGTYLKLFRVKRIFTSARLFPYWRRFEQNAPGLKALQIPTFNVIQTYKIPHLDRTAVHYEPLPGLTLREIGEFDEAAARQFGCFLRELHDKGVYLRSLHLGNVVRTPEATLGLIDIADMRLYGRSLPRRLRFRNFHHLCRYVEDRATVAVHLSAFLEAFDERDHDRLRTMFAPN